MKKIILAAASIALLAGCSTTTSQHQYSQMNEQVKVFYKGRMAPRNYTVIRTEKNQQTVANPDQHKLTRQDFRATEKQSIYNLQQAALNAGGNAIVGTVCVARVANDSMAATVICQAKLARVGVKAATANAAPRATKTAARNAAGARNAAASASRKAAARTNTSSRRPATNNNNV